MTMICRGRWLKQQRLPADPFHEPCGECHACLRASSGPGGSDATNATKQAEAAKAEALRAQTAAPSVVIDVESPEGLADALRAHTGRIQGVEPPSANASKATWVDYAVAAGWERSDAEALTRADLRAAFTEESSP